MDVSEVEETLFISSDAKLHGGMCKVLSTIVCKVLGVFPALEAAQPRSKSGIQALCSLHVALEKSKDLLQHCSECSKLYLAITGDSVLSKFEKARCVLVYGLKNVKEIVPEDKGFQISEIISELEGTMFSLDTSEKHAGEKLIALLQQERKFDSNENNDNQIVSLHQIVSILGITSSRATLTERRALKKMIERARIEEDRRKESIVAYLLHLMRKHSKLFGSEVWHNIDILGSAPCSPTVWGSYKDVGGAGKSGHANQQLSKLVSLSLKPNSRRSEKVPGPPEELRCPISLQLMYDPVIISSGQTYERLCIEKWFRDGHNTCPKTQQQLSHLCLTPNYCVKSLVASWCEENGFPLPDGPPESLDLNYWRLSLSGCGSMNSPSMESISSSKVMDLKVDPLGEISTAEQPKGSEMGSIFIQKEEFETDVHKRYEDLLALLRDGMDTKSQCKVVEQIRLLLKDDDGARTFMGANGLVGALVTFLGSAVHEGNEEAQQIGAMALFNLAVNNSRNKEMMLSAGAIPVLEEMILKSYSYGSVAALYLNISCLEEAKPIIGSSKAVPFLVGLFRAHEIDPQCKRDALHALYNLSTHRANIPRLLSASTIECLQSLISEPADHTWTENAIAVLINLASSASGRDEIISTPGLISGLAAIMEMGLSIEQEQAVSCLLMLCTGNGRCSEMVLQEGVIPALVSISVNGTTRGKEKAHKLLRLFREQQQGDSSPVRTCQQSESSGRVLPTSDLKPMCKSTSKRMNRAWSALWKSKNFSISQWPKR